MGGRSAAHMAPTFSYAFICAKISFRRFDISVVFSSSPALRSALSNICSSTNFASSGDDSFSAARFFITGLFVFISKSTTGLGRGESFMAFSIARICGEIESALRTAAGLSTKRPFVRTSFTSSPRVCLTQSLSSFTLSSGIGFGSDFSGISSSFISALSMFSNLLPSYSPMLPIMKVSMGSNRYRTSIPRALKASM